MARILVVEDDPQSALIVERMLTRMGGHQVVVTQSPDAVLENLRTGGVDLMLLDVSLQDSTLAGQKIDGVALCRKIKSNPELPAVPVILVTAHAMRGDRERFLQESRADGYLTKPILDYRALCQFIQDTLSPPPPLESLPGSAHLAPE